MNNETNEILELLSKSHLVWLKMARSLNRKMSLQDAEDLVSEMYLNMHKYVDNIEKIIY